MRCLLALILFTAPVAAAEEVTIRRQTGSEQLARPSVRQTQAEALEAPPGMQTTAVPITPRRARPWVDPQKGHICGTIQVGDSVVRLSC